MWTQLRSLLASAFFAISLWPAEAHHGWGHYDTSSPLILEGRVIEVTWANPHPELVVEVSAEEAPPAASSLPVPPELQALGFAETAAAARPADARRWTLDLAPIGRLEQWGLPRAPVVGDTIQAIGFPACAEEGVIRPSLIVIDGVGVRQQSVRLPGGCSGRPRG